MGYFTGIMDPCHEYVWTNFHHDYHEFKGLFHRDLYDLSSCKQQYDPWLWWNMGYTVNPQMVRQFIPWIWWPTKGLDIALLVWGKNHGFHGNRVSDKRFRACPLNIPWTQPHPATLWLLTSPVYFFSPTLSGPWNSRQAAAPEHRRHNNAMRPAV